MIRLKSRTQACVNGFWFRQAQTGWEKQSWDFESLCQEVAAHRASNPRHNLTTDLNSIRAEVDEYNARRMQSIRGADIYITSDGPSPPLAPAPQHTRHSWPSVVGGAKHVVAGVGILVDWLGSGAMPVLNDIANSRAGTCADCPQNQPGDIFSIFTAPIAEKLRTQLEMRRSLNLSTPVDDKLKICKACHCPLTLKVHVPLQHIKDHLTDDVQADLDPRCWILSELSHHSNTPPLHVPS
jgi:hypothetical protein